MLCPASCMLYQVPLPFTEFKLSVHRLKQLSLQIGSQMVSECFLMWERVWLGQSPAVHYVFDSTKHWPDSPDIVQSLYEKTALEQLLTLFLR